MAHQSPMISIPRKTTEEVDWTTPIRNLIAQSYGESPDNYANECASLQRCRQDAVRGAGSDTTARDLLYKYFGQLELLELRFSEIRVNFPWRDAFTNKLITQTSIAYEKASILFQIASTHSAIASSQSRSDPEGVKRTFHYFRTCAGMLTYINENFLHAPSTDLSREVIKFLVSLILAQATEVFFEKCADEKKGHALVAKIGAQAASMYTSLTEEVKEFMGKGIFDRNWITLIQIKSKYFLSLSQYYRGLADHAASKYGDALVRFTLAENLAKEASRSATSFNSMFVSSMSPTLPPDAGSSLQDRTKAHLALVSERKGEAQRENDLIYNAILPSPEALPAIDKTAVATPIPIQEVYGTPEVQKTIGQDFFIRLIPLSVHESASVYSEEKAKLVRGEVEKAEGAEGEIRSVLDGMGVKEGLTRFRAMAEGEVGSEAEVPIDVRRWKEDITLIEGRESVDSIIGQLSRLKDSVRSQLDTVQRDLDNESRECEALRVKYGHRWTQEPSAGLSKSLRQDLKSHLGAFEAAGTSDHQVMSLWDSVRGEIHLLMSPAIEDVFRLSTESAGPGSENLLDLDIGGESADDQERAKIGNFVSEIDGRLGTLNKISRQRKDVLRDLKEKIQTDDVSHLLLLNRRNTGVEPALFAAELEKFKPLQEQLSVIGQQQDQVLQEVSKLWKALKDHGSRGSGARRWDERERRKKETVNRFSRARDVYMEIRDGVAKGLQFYTDLTDLTKTLQQNVKSFVSNRVSERERLAGQLEVEKRLSSNTSPPPLAAKPPLPPPPPSKDLSSSFSGMNLGSGSQWQSTPPPPPQSYGTPQYTPHTVPQRQNSYSQPLQYNNSSQQPSAPPTNYSGQYQQPSSSSFLPPPPPPTIQSSINPPPGSDPYASLGMFNSYAPQPPPQLQQQAQQPQQQQQQQHYGYGQQSYPSPPPQQQQPGQYQTNQPPYGLPPPPPPVNYQYGQQPQPPHGNVSPPSQGYGGYSQGYGR